MIKKTATMFVAIILAMCLMTSVVSAAPAMNVRQSGIAAPGELFAVDIMLSESPGLKTLQCLVTFDEKSVTLLNCSDGGYFDSFMTLPTTNGVYIFWSTDANGDNYSSGVLSTIVFQASAMPSNYSLMSVEVIAATNSFGSDVTIAGSTIPLQFSIFGADDDDEIIVEDEEDEGWIADDDDEIIVDDEEDEGWIADDDDEVIVDDEEVTTAATKETKATTTTKKTSATTTTKATTTEATTTTESQTTPETTTEEVTTPQTTPEVTTTPETTPSQSVSFSGDEATATAQKKMATGGTVLVAVILVCVTVAAVAGINIWKKSKE